MIVPRKMSLQLTPLLDLLLIVIFAQYMEVQETQVTIVEKAATTTIERDAALAALSEKEADLQQVQDELKTTIQQEQVIASLLVDLFDVPEEEVQAILDKNVPPGGRTAMEIERLKERFKQTTVEQSGRVIEHLLTYDEIRKRCDIWDVHVTPQNFLTLSSGDKTLQIQIPLDIDEEFVQQTFVEKFIETAHTLPEPKSLVITMLTYDRRSQRWAVQGVREALPQISLRLNSESDARTRYDYADLGFRIE